MLIKEAIRISSPSCYAGCEVMNLTKPLRPGVSLRVAVLAAGRLQDSYLITFQTAYKVLHYPLRFLVFVISEENEYAE